MVRVSAVGWTAVIAMFSGKSKQAERMRMSSAFINEVLLPEELGISTH
jgi:hypothetical protein